MPTGSASTYYYGNSSRTTYTDECGRPIGSSETTTNYDGSTTTIYKDQYGRNIGTKTSK